MWQYLFTKEILDFKAGGDGAIVTLYCHSLVFVACVQKVQFSRHFESSFINSNQTFVILRPSQSRQ